MKKGNHTFTLQHVLSSVLMLVLLTWLTVCLPVVNSSQKATKAQTEQSSNDADGDNTNPLTNTNEEKSENGTSMLSEYLHEVLVVERHFTILSSLFNAYPSDLYLAYHPDLIIPPPEV